MRAIHTIVPSDGSETGLSGAKAEHLNLEKLNGAMNCDRIARIYRVAEYLAFAGALQACRTMYLGEVTDCRRALICGDGDGRFLAEFLRENREVLADYIDLSPGMAGIARQRVADVGAGASARTTIYVGDARQFNPDEGARYDLVTAHFFLDCFGEEEIENVARKLASFAQAGALLLSSEFRVPPRGIKRYVNATIIRGLYAAFRLTTGLRVKRLPDYEGALERAGFRKEREAQKIGGLLVASLWRKR